MDNNEEIKDEEIEVVIEKEEPKEENIDKTIEEIKEKKAEGCKCNTKMLDNWLFFCFDVLLLIFVLGISIYIVDMRENLRILNQKADRIEEYVNEDDQPADTTEVQTGETVDVTDTTAEETTTTADTTVETATDTTQVTQ